MQEIIRERIVFYIAHINLFCSSENVIKFSKPALNWKKIRNKYDISKEADIFHIQKVLRLI